MMNTRTVRSDLSLISLCSSWTLATLFGLRSSKIYCLRLRMAISSLSILMPPEVDPEHPQTRESATTIQVAKGGHTAVSVVA